MTPISIPPQKIGRMNVADEWKAIETMLPTHTSKKAIWLIRMDLLHRNGSLQEGHRLDSWVFHTGSLDR
jgi:hypothetical protein